MSLQRKPAKTSRIALFLDAHIKKRRIDNLAVDERKELTTVTQSKDDLLRQIVMDKAINNSNVLSYACAKYDAQSNLDQYQLLENFILNQHKNQTSSANVIHTKQENSNSIDIKPQQTTPQPFDSNKLHSNNSLFSNLLFPTFQHTFIDLLINGYKTDALEFLKQKNALFNDEKSYKYLRDITGTRDPLKDDDDDESMKLNTKELNQYIYDMKTKKYKVSIPEDQFNNLMAFLKCQDSMFLVQIINRYMHLVVTTDEDETGSGAFDAPIGEGGGEMGGCKMGEGGGGEVGESKMATHDDGGIKKEWNSKEVVSEVEKRLKGLYGEDPPSLPLLLRYSFCDSNKGLTQLRITEDGNKVVATYEDSSIKLWCGLQCEQASEEQRPCHLRGHSSVVYDAEFMGINKLISASADQTVRLWGEEEEGCLVLYRGHTAQVVDVAVSPIAGQFSSSSCDHTSKLWCCDRIYPLRSFIGHTKTVNRACFHQNGCYLASAGSDGVVRMWDVNAVGRCVRLMTCQPCIPLTSVAFSPDGKSLAAGAIDGSVKVWDIGSGSLMKSFPHQAPLTPNTSTQSQKPPSFCPVYSVTFNPQSSHLFSGGGDGKVHVWDMNDNTTPQNKNNRCHSGPQTSIDAGGMVMNLKYSPTNILYVLTKTPYLN